jgi:hypothetical protein
MVTNRRSITLRAAARHKQIVRFTRPFDKDSVNGYVLAVGPRWFLVAVVSGDIRFDGFECFRLHDVRELEVPHPHAEFAEAALKKRGQRISRRPRVSVASSEELLRSANQSFPLVAIYREQVDPDHCWIGRIREVDKRLVALLEIDADAHWDDRPTAYRLSEITRVDFGGGYEDALHIVGGPPPGE